MEQREIRIELRKGHAGTASRKDTTGFVYASALRNAIPEYARDWKVMHENDASLMLVAPDNSGKWEHHVTLEFAECEHASMTPSGHSYVCDECGAYLNESCDDDTNSPHWPSDL